jgi:hypothetical protein
MVVAMAIISCMFYGSALLSVVFAALAMKWTFLVFVPPFLLLYMLFLVVVSIPLFLNWSRNTYGALMFRILFLGTFSIVMYSWLYRTCGIQFNGAVVHDLVDSVYFSVTTWTTLGYGDFTSQSRYRLLTSAEALTGMVYVPLLTSLIWLYCSERIHEKTEADEDISGRPMRQDRTFGFMREVDTPETLQAQAERKKRYGLVVCKKCGTAEQEIEKYFDVTGRTHALPKFAVVCSCGQFTKPHLNAHLAAYQWNRANR